MSTFIVKNSSDVIPVGTTLVEVANNEIERLPSLPVSITGLYCYSCTSLRELPPLSHCVGLTELNCLDCTSLRELPPLLHCVRLQILNCYGCISLCKLPSLPVSLTQLYCYGCTSLRELPPLPVSLVDLSCFYCTSLRELPSLPISLTYLYCNRSSLLYLPIIPRTCSYYGPSLPTEEEYFKQVNMGKNQEFVASRGDALLYRIIGKDITDMVKGYLS
jgi:hypothetical protein